jgi:hypothetical protein
LAFGALLLLSSVVGCEGDDTETPDAGSERDGAAGPADRDAAADAGDAGMDAGDSGDAGRDTGSEGDAGESCVHTGPPLVNVREFDKCTLCDNARCIPDELVGATYAGNLADCPNEGEKCVPEMYIQTGGFFLLESCRSLNDAEGRCVSLCIPDIAEQEDRLPQDECEDDERCAPCYDPITGEDTGACTVSCDEGPTEQPVIFDACCDEIGSCISSDYVDVELQGRLPKEKCADGELCVPNAFTDAGGFVPESCVSPGGGEGRCLPTCLPEVAEEADRLLRDICPEDHLCVPCYDPLTGEETEACGLSEDPGPGEPAYTFDECCGGKSVCAPEEIVPGDQQDLLGKDSCDEGFLCVPRELAELNAYAPTFCTGWNDSEGRCLLACLPDVAKQADMLLQDICDDDYLCVPCYDPVDGEETGACSLEGDPGPQQGAFTFPECCGGVSVCIPTELIPAADLELLGRDTCEDPNDRCIPRELTEPDGHVPTSCKSWNDAEGRCLPACLPDVAEQADRLRRDVCPKGYLCAPCYDPVTGERTSACDVSVDPGPQDPPYTFPGCCDGRGVCTPEAAIPADDREQLGQMDCATSGDLCVPREVAEDPDGYIPEFCRSWDNAEGRCLSTCIAEVAADDDRLSQSRCRDGYLCVPCYDQLTGEETGACSNGADPGPSEPPIIFDECCGGLAVCVPDISVPADDQDALAQDSCERDDHLCTPKDWAEAPSTHVPEFCRSWRGAEARCLPACLPEVDYNKERMAQHGCPDDYLCAPCYDHVTRELTDSCFVAGDPGPSEGPVFFDKCCDDNSVCVPEEAVLPEDRAFVGRDTCALPDDLCVPYDMAVHPTRHVPDTCYSWGGGEGRCLLDCLPDVAEAAEMLSPGTIECPVNPAEPCTRCPDDYLCAPCYDPLTGEETGSCTSAGDPGPVTPPEEAVVFEKCCELEIDEVTDFQGTCIPRAATGPNGQYLSRGGCPVDPPGTHPEQQNDFVCTPNLKVADPQATFLPCETIDLFPTTIPPKDWSGLPGACIPDCFIDGIIAFGFGDCKPNVTCAPCNNPLTGEVTGACL